MEIWRDIDNFPGYQVSSAGQVRSSKRGKSILLGFGGPRNGYNTVVLYRNGKRFSFSVHSLVLNAFVGVCPEGMECRHLNSVRFDNRLENLKWGTKSENGQDRVKAGNQISGTTHHEAKLNPAKVREMKVLIKMGLTYKTVAAKYGIHSSTAWSAVNGENWK